MSAPVDRQLSRLLRLYGTPKPHEDEGLPPEELDAFFNEYRRALGGIDAELLDCAVCNVVDERTIPAWPTPGEIRKAVQDIAGERAAQVRYSALSVHEPEPTPEEVANRKAMRERIGVSLANVLASTPTGTGVGWFCAACIAKAGRSFSEPYRKAGTPPRYEDAGDIEPRPYYAGEGWCHVRPYHAVAAGVGLWWFRDWRQPKERGAAPLDVSRPAWEARLASSETARRLALSPEVRDAQPRPALRAPHDPDAWRRIIDDEVAADVNLDRAFNE